MTNEARLLIDFENAENKVYTIDASDTYTHYDYPDVNSVIEFVQNSINNVQETITIQKDSSITDEGVGKLDIASANIFTSTTGPHLYKVGAASTTLYNGILYNGTVPFKNVTDDSLVRIQKDAVIYYAGGVAYCFTGEGIYSLLWDDTEKKGWVTKVKMDNETYYISYLQDSLPDVTVTAGDFTWNATERTLTATGAASTTKTATIKFNEAVDGVYFSLSNNSGTGRMGILSAKVNSEDYYIGLLQGLGTEYTQWYMQKDDVLTITYEGDSTSTANETFVFKIEHWQKSAQTTSVSSYTNYAIGNSELNEQITTGRMQTDILNLQYDMNEYYTKAVQKPSILTGNYPNLQLTLSAASDNTEWRIIQGSQGDCSLTIGLDISEIGEESVFGCTVVFKTPYRSTATTSFSWATDYGDIVSIAGDDVVDGIFTPQLLRVYEMVFTWNGFVMNCVVKGSKYTAPKE